MDDAPNYERVEVNFINGAPPELVLLGENDRELERLPLSQLTRQQCNELIQERGFTKKNKDKELQFLITLGSNCDVINVKT